MFVKTPELFPRLHFYNAETVDFKSCFNQHLIISGVECLCKIPSPIFLSYSVL